jgi:hypothetical protein
MRPDQDRSTRPDRSTGPDSAIRLDAAIDHLLAGQAALLSTAGEPEDLELLATAKLLHEGLPRFHPRFGFEELLARRLAGANEAARPPAVAVPSVGRAGRIGSPRSLPGTPPDAGAPRSGEDAATDPRASLRRRGLVAGGAIASGLSLAIPIAGAALVAWRRSRPSGGIG